MSDLKTSILINRQLPEFIREEYPQFIAFLEAYYEFLETKQGTNLNDVLKVSKDARYFTDIDKSLEQFEEQFFNTFIPLLSKNTIVSKDFLIKNVLPLYLSKGSKESFILLFKLLFNEEPKIIYPKDFILRASDGRWNIPKILRVFKNIASLHLGDGVKNSFTIVPSVDLSGVIVFKNNILQTEGVDYYIRKELYRIYFYNTPNENDNIVIEYEDFDFRLIENRKLISEFTKLESLIESASFKKIGAETYYELFLKEDFTDKFINGEFVNVDIFVNEEIVNLRLKTVSDLDSIEITNGGSNYNVGDPVLIIGPSTKQATAVVDSVATGILENLIVLYGGSGFQLGNKVKVKDLPEFVLDAFVFGVFPNQKNTVNSVSIISDVINDYVDVTLDSLDYGFPSDIEPEEDINTVLANAFSEITIDNLGPITSVSVNSSFLFEKVEYLVESPEVVNDLQLSNFGIIGRIDIIDGGQDYEIGDELIFISDDDYFGSFGAEAFVSNVSPSGIITEIQIVNGGQGYYQENLPQISIQSENGSGAELVATSVLGKGEILNGILENAFPGQILSIKITDRGSGYVINPEIDLTGFGDGTATAQTKIRDSFVKLPGNWTTTDSLLSSDRVIEGRDYYTDFTYVISSKVEFSRYKELFKQLVHPAGFKQYAQYAVEDFVIVTDKINSQLKTISANILGTVNINSSIYVIGTNTHFLSTKNTGFLTEGQYILVNSEIRIVDNIINNTILTVSEPFETTSNDQTLILVYSPYNSLTNEVWVELISSNDDVLTTEKDYEGPPIYFSTDEY
jgi:hypothetical protein